MKAGAWRRLIPAIFLSAALILAALPECTIKYRPQRREGRARKEIPYFLYENKGVLPQVKGIQGPGSHVLEKIAFPSSMRPYRVRGYLYYPRSGALPPTILIIPILAGSYSFSRHMAEYLVDRGFSCLRFERTAPPLDPARGLGHTQRLLRHGIIDIRRTVDWLAQRNGPHSPPVGIMGISMGAVVAALAVEVEPRIRAAAMILGGGDIATILTRSREDLLVQFRERIMATRALGLDQFQELAQDLMRPVDPLTYASRVDPHQILMVNARFDRVIPYENSRRLWEAMGRPRWIRLPTGHYTAVLYLPYIRYRTLHHFREVFAMPEDP